MTSSASPAPFEELASLRARVQQFESQIVERDVLLEQRAATIEQHEATIERLHEQVRLLLARRFGASSEKLPDAQLGLFNEAEAEAGEEPEADAGTEVAAHRRARPVRAPLPESLERVDIEHELADSERTCPHHGVELERFAEVVSEQLDIVRRRCGCCVMCAASTVARAAQGIFALPRCRRSRGEELRKPRAARVHRHGEVRRRAAAVSPATTVRAYRGGAVAHDAGAVDGGDGRTRGAAINLLRDELLERLYLMMDETTVQARQGPGVEVSALGTKEWRTRTADCAV